MFVERVVLSRDLGGTVHDDIEVAGHCLQDANIPTGSYIGPKGSNTL